MFQNSAISLDHAPPISVVFRFLLAGSIWGIVGGVYAIFVLPNIDVATSEAIILTHIFTLGVMMSFMFGAMFQMLPVLAGVSFEAPLKTALKTHYLLTFGTIFLLITLKNNDSFLYTLATAFLIGAIALPLYMLLPKLFLLKTHSASSKGMFVALVVLAAVGVLGLALFAARAIGIELKYYIYLKSMHLHLGLFGWIGVLVMSVAFQVIEMFYVTPPYPKIMKQYLPVGLAGLMFFDLFASFVGVDLHTLVLLMVYLLMFSFGAITLIRVFQRKRAVVDATVWFWRLALVCLMIATLTLSLNLFIQSAILQKLAIVGYFGFFVTVLFAMSYKIIPFLVWFHLNKEGYFNAPMMHEVVSPKYSMLHLYIHLAAVVLLFLSTVIEIAWFAGATIIAVSFAFVFVAIYRAWHIYLHEQKYGQKMEINYK